MEDNMSPKPVQSSDSAINIKWFISSLLGVWPWFLISIIVAMSIGQLYLRYTTPIYSVSSEISLYEGKKSGNEAAVLEGLGINTTKSDLEKEVRILKSNSLMARVVKDLKLNIRYLVTGRLKTNELYVDRAFMFVPLVPAETIEKFKTFKLKYENANSFVLTDEGKQIKANWGDTLNITLGKSVLVNNTTEIQHDF